MAIIAISRGPYTGGKELAARLAEILEYPMITRPEIIHKVAEYGISDERVSTAHHRQLSARQKADLEWIHYMVCFRSILASRIQSGNLVYVGDNGQALLRGFPNVLAVRVITDMESRIQNLMKRNDYVIDRKEARRLIQRIDEHRTKWVRTLYGKSTNDPFEFDLVIDLNPMSIEDACELIRTTVELPQFQTTQETLKTIGDMALAADLRARIAMEADILDDNLEVEIRDGTINVLGSVHSEADADAIKNILSKQPEVEAVEEYLKSLQETTEQNMPQH